MAGKTPEKVTVRWVDSKTGEDFTDRMNDPSQPPGEGILKLAAALGRLIAAQQIEAERQLLKALGAKLMAQTDEGRVPGTPRSDDEVTVDGVTYRYDGATDDGEHFTRLQGEAGPEALVSLRRGSAAADWMLRRLENPAATEGR